MKIIPAIDIRDGKVVRLTQGMAEKEKLYSDFPLDVAKMWDSYGVELIHIIDLDAAFKGSLKNIDIIKKITANIKAKVELGGGMRSEEALKAAFNSGVAKVVIGTKAFDQEFLKMAVSVFGERIVVGIDAKDGMVHTKGWLFKTEAKVIDFVRKIEKAGVKTINYTDISRDGTLEGPNFKSIADLLEETDMKVVMAGGVSTIDDIKKLKKFTDFGLDGVIIGKALYERTIDLGEAMRVCE